MNLDERQSIVVKASDIFSERCFAKIIGWIRMDQQSAEREAKVVGANIGDAQSGKEQTMSKKKPCGLDYCPQEELIGIYASCTACAWGNDGDDESGETDDE